MLRISIIIFVSMFLPGCPKHFPKFTEDIKVYMGTPEEIGICRCEEFDGDECIDLQCVSAADDEFMGYQCMTHDDQASVQAYIVKLITKCRKWRR